MRWDYRRTLCFDITTYSEEKFMHGTVGDGHANPCGQDIVGFNKDETKIVGRLMERTVADIQQSVVNLGAVTDAIPKSTICSMAYPFYPKSSLIRKIARMFYGDKDFSFR